MNARIKFWLAPAMAAISLLAACGGEGEPQATSKGTARDARALAAGSETALAPQPPLISVESLTKLRETRIGRTTFEYEFRVNLRNAGGETATVQVQLDQVPKGTEIVDGVALFSSVPAGLSSSTTDTVTVRHNRTEPFNLAALTWAIRLATPLPVQRVQVDIAATVPAETRSQVAEVLSRVGSVAPGGALMFEVDDGIAANTVTAIDTNGRIRLAGRIKGPGRVVLDADTTAMEMARWAIPSVPGYESVAAFDDFVRRKSGYAVLVAGVNTALALGRSPFAVPAAANALNALVAQATERATTSVAASGLARRSAKPMAIPVDRPTGAPPIPVLGMPDGRAVSLRDAPLRLESTHALSWAVQTTDLDGKALLTSPGAREQLLQPYLLDDQIKLLLEVLERAPHPTVFLPDDSGRSIGLAVRQTQETFLYNSSIILAGFGKLALDIKGTPSCMASVGKLLLGDVGNLAALMTSPSESAVIALLESRMIALGGKTIGGILIVPKDIAGECLKKTGSPADVFLAGLKVLTPWLYAGIEAYKTGDKVFAGLHYASMLALQIQSLVDTSKRERSIGVCFKSYDVIGNCAQALQLSPSQLLMSPGAMLDGPAVTATDVAGKSTVVPYLTLDINVAQSKADVVDVSRKLDGLKVVAAGVGDATVSLTDTATGATTAPGNGQLIINVRSPRFSSPVVDVSVGETIELPFVDSTGRRFDVNGPTSFMASTSTNIEIYARVNGVREASPTRATSLQVKGVSAGEAVIWATNVATGVPFELKVRVRGACIDLNVGDFARLGDPYAVSTVTSLRSGNCVQYGGDRSGTFARFDRDALFVRSSELSVDGISLTRWPGKNHSDQTIFSDRVSDSGSILLTRCRSATFVEAGCLFDVKSKRLIRIAPDLRDGLLSADGRYVVFRRRLNAQDSSDFTHWLFDIETGIEKCLTCAAQYVDSRLQEVQVVAISYDGVWVVLDVNRRIGPHSIDFIDTRSGSIVSIPKGTAYFGLENIYISKIGDRLFAIGARYGDGCHLSVADRRSGTVTTTKISSVECWTSAFDFEDNSIYFAGYRPPSQLLRYHIGSGVLENLGEMPCRIDCSSYPYMVKGFDPVSGTVHTGNYVESVVWRVKPPAGQ